MCPRCDRTVDQARGVGQSAMMLSVRDFLGVPGHLRSMTDIDGLVGWGVLSGARPNERPWQHVDLSEIGEVAALLTAGV